MSSIASGSRAFQSTHLVWGATTRETTLPIWPVFQSTHLVWGATSTNFLFSWHLLNFNPRTSCEVRHALTALWMVVTVFQSTHLVWGATYSVRNKRRNSLFQSTHLVWGATLFSIRSDFSILFQSTHLVWGATGIDKSSISRYLFQSTHLVWGATHARADYYYSITYFNPRTSCEVRQSRSFKSFIW